MGKKTVTRVFLVTDPLDNKGAVTTESVMEVDPGGGVSSIETSNLFFDDEGFAVGAGATALGIVARCSDCGKFLSEAALTVCERCGSPHCTACAQTLSDGESDTWLHFCDSHYADEKRSRSKKRIKELLVNLFVEE